MTREEFLDLLPRLRRASVGNVPAPHKPLLLLWLFGRFAATGSTAVAYTEAEEPVSTLINDFGPPVAKASAGRRRAAMPFVHLEREISDLRDGSGAEIGPDAPSGGRGWPGVRRLAGALDTQRAGLALADLVALPARRAPHRPLLPRCWELPDDLTIYDATYVALASETATDSVRTGLLTCTLVWPRRANPGSVRARGDEA